MIWGKLMNFIHRLKGSVPDENAIPPWKHELTPEYKKREMETRTRLQKQTVARMRMDLKAIAEEHKHH